MLPLLPNETTIDCAGDTVAASYDRQFGVDVLLRFASGMQATLQEKFLGTTFDTVTVEYYQDWRTEEPGDWFRLRVDYYFVGYHQPDASTFRRWILLDWPAVQRATSRGLIDWQERRNAKDGARASFRYVAFDAIPAECIIDQSANVMRGQAFDTLTVIAGQQPRAIDWDARRRRAEAFLQQHRRTGQSWADLVYDYRDEP